MGILHVQVIHTSTHCMLGSSLHIVQYSMATPFFFNVCMSVHAHTCMYTHKVMYLHVRARLAFLAKCDPINGHRLEARSR